MRMARSSPLHCSLRRYHGRLLAGYGENVEWYLYTLVGRGAVLRAAMLENGTRPYFRRDRRRGWCFRGLAANLSFPGSIATATQVAIDVRVHCAVHFSLGGGASLIHLLQGK